jgi:outer membrane protein
MRVHQNESAGDKRQGGSGSLHHRLTMGVGALAVLSILAAAPATAETLRQALASTYRYNPRLDAERARLRATDEEVPKAKSGYRPTVTGSADAGHQSTKSDPRTTSNGETNAWGYTLNVTQPVFSGFRTLNATREAEAQVRAGRENLRNIEQQVLLEAITAYADVVRDQAAVRARERNVGVLTRELQAAEARRAVREVTRTDVAQAKARRARAVSEFDRAKANLKVSRATFEKVVGHPAQHLAPPSPPTKLLPRALETALSIAEKESPNLVSALYREQAARHNVDRIWGELLPDVRLEASYSHRYNPSGALDEQETASVAGRVTVPLYEAGETRARVRQAKHTHVSRLQEIEQARAETQAIVTQAWSRYAAARAQLKSDQVQVEANRTALEGVREEEKVGQRSLLDVLNAEQELLDAEVQLISTRRDLIVAAYTLIAATGRLTAPELDIVAETYDPNAHYEEVRSKWFGIDITRADGRTEALDVSLESDPAWVLDE